MVWETVYTDGRVFATENFMEVYRRNSGFLDEEHFHNAVRSGGIELLLARITAVCENENFHFQDYDLSSERGTATLTLHPGFRTNPAVCSSPAGRLPF